jgi:hypothetical protein
MEPYESLLLWNVPLYVTAVVCGVVVVGVGSGALGLDPPQAEASHRGSVRSVRARNERTGLSCARCAKRGYAVIPY